MLQALIDPRVLVLSAIYFTGVTASYGVVFFLPQIVKGLGLTQSDDRPGHGDSVHRRRRSACCVWGYSSDRFKERRWHLIISTALGRRRASRARPLFNHSFLAVAAMCVATIGIYGSRPSFWPMPSLFLSGAAAAVGMAFINSIGNLGGYRRSLRRRLDQGQHQELRDGAVLPGRVCPAVCCDRVAGYAIDGYAARDAGAERGAAARQIGRTATQAQGRSPISLKYRTTPGCSNPSRGAAASAFSGVVACAWARRRPSAGCPRCRARTNL